MNDRDVYFDRLTNATAIQNVDIIVDLLIDAETPFWIRRDGADLVIRSEDDVFAISTFNRLFLPIHRVREETHRQLLEHWLEREARARSRIRLTYLRRFLVEAASFVQLPDRLYQATLALLAAWTEGPNPLQDWSEVSRVVRRFLDTWKDSAPERLMQPRLLRAALWSCDLKLMRELVDLGTRFAQQPESLQMIHFLLMQLVAFDETVALLPRVEAMHRRDSTNVVAIHNLAQVRRALMHDVGDIAALYMAVDTSKSPNHLPGAINWIAQACYAFDLREEAAALFAMMPAPTNGSDARSWQQRVLQRPDAAQPLSPPRPSATRMLDLPGLAPVLAHPLERAAELIQADVSRRSPLSAKEIERGFRRVADSVAAVPRPSPLPDECLRGAQRMMGFAKAYFEPHLGFLGISPVPLEEKYGRMDLERMRAAYLGALAVVINLVELGLESILAGATVRQVEQCFRLMNHLVDACLAAGEPDRALVLIRRLMNFANCRDVASRLAELCCLAKGDIAAAQALLLVEARDRCTFYRVVDRETWTRAEGLAWEVFVDDPETRGAFDVDWSDIGLMTYDHVVPPVRIALARPDLLVVRRGEVLRGQKDMILRPTRFHHPMTYPERTPDVAAGADGAVRLLNLAEPVEINEDVLVLENFDALRHRNYYHWLALILARINYLKDRGWLEGRRLVVPEGLSKWMIASLHAIGVADDDLLIAPMGLELRLTNALLCSSVEFASPTLLRALRNKLLPRGETGEERGPVHLFLSRRGQLRRPFLNEAEIEAIAGSLGFQIVQPETMTIFEQADLFGRAASVVGAEGAAFANIMFCQPGARILTLLNENDLFPTFNDLATLGELAHRKVTAKGEPDDLGVISTWAPFSIDISLAERGMRWAMGG